MNALPNDSGTDESAGTRRDAGDAGAINPGVTHAHLNTIVRRLPSDYSDFGGAVERWANTEEDYPDCSCGCLWAVWLAGTFNGDWCVCANPKAPRRGLLTFEHQAGKACFTADQDDA